MILENIEISLEKWGENKGRYVGRARFAHQGGKIEINLLPDTADKVLTLLATQVVSAAQETAKMMASTVISDDAIKKALSAEGF
jgi:hypothetical protein